MYFAHFPWGSLTPPFSIPPTQSDNIVIITNNIISYIVKTCYIWYYTAAHAVQTIWSSTSYPDVDRLWKHVFILDISDFGGGRKRLHGNPHPLVCVGKHWQACTLQFISCTVHLHSVARSFFFFIHCLMSSFICLLAVLSHFKVGQSISPRLDIHSTGMKHEGIKKHRRLNTSTTELNCCGKNLNQLVNKMLCRN